MASRRQRAEARARHNDRRSRKARRCAAPSDGSDPIRDAEAPEAGAAASAGLGSLSETVGLGGVFGKVKAAVADRAPRRRAGDGGALIIMIVLGGLTFSEIRDANAVLEELGARDRVVLGGTRLCTGQDVAEALFFADDEDF